MNKNGKYTLLDNISYSPCVKINGNESDKTKICFYNDMKNIFRTQLHACNLSINLMGLFVKYE